MAVWAKDRPGQGSFLRSQHELILIFKIKGKMRNNVMLGKYGRSRANVWSYPSALTASKGSDEGNILAEHPTPKPVRLVADEIGRESCRESVCKYVEISVVAVTLKKTNKTKNNTNTTNKN